MREYIINALYDVAVYTGVVVCGYALTRALVWLDKPVKKNKRARH